MERKLTKYLILISLILFTSQIFSQSQIKLLERAYKENSDSLMQIFFNNWKSMTPFQYNNYEEANDTIKAIKEIYKSFYDSLEFFKKDKINLLPNDLEYGIVNYVMCFQWYLDSAFFEIEKNNLRRDTLQCPEILIEAHTEKLLYNAKITNFRPKITEAKTLFLDSLYVARINSFLVGKYRKEYWTNLVKDLKDRPDKFLAKLEFLKSYFNVIESGDRIYDKNDIYYYNKYLQLLSKYSIHEIHIDKSLNYSIVKTIDDNCIVYYYMCKNENKWIIKKKSRMCFCGG
ncbi:MAG: hypothetical protein JSS63_00810 [Bacteroidetes bacterium]|nr:hypothetical protein [Bacteroidota bacterium]